MIDIDNSDLGMIMIGIIVVAVIYYDPELAKIIVPMGLSQIAALAGAKKIRKSGGISGGL